MLADISTHPAWYRFIFNFLYKIKFDVYYTNFMQYRRYGVSFLCTLFAYTPGLHFEDILAETPAVAQALERVPGEVLSDRDDRLKQALVLHAAGDVLPKDNWATAATDKAYMAPYLIQTVQERRDREAFRPR